jgi:HPt (histidine-containing phosphotransfer) domain-containing protein
MPSEGRSRQALRAELPVFDQDSLVERVLGDVDIARQVAARAIDDITRHRIGLSEALESADSEKLHFHAHSLKGVSKLMECHQLARCAEVIDGQSTHQIIAEARKETESIMPLINAAIDALDDFCCKKKRLSTMLLTERNIP